jgi:acetate kinase
VHVGERYGVGAAGDTLGEQVKKAQGLALREERPPAGTARPAGPAARARPPGRAGLLALAGTADMRAVIAAAAAGESRARLAFDVYIHRLRAGVAAMAASMDGLDALAFTGGVGENAPAVRAAAAVGLSFLGVGLDSDRNAAAQPDADIAASDAPVRALVIAAREDLEIALQVRSVLADGS